MYPARMTGYKTIRKLLGNCKKERNQNMSDKNKNLALLDLQ